MDKARYIMIGGFLGAGKTTAILRLAEHLHAYGKRVGLITNDQARGLVDTARVSADQWPVEEIAGGCFCCRFNSLVEASQRLAQHAQPDVFIAEPVGSCTDLVATVSFPLRRMYGDDYRVAPLSVLVDPIRALRILGLEPGKKFSEKVLYIYLKQLEEADIIVINKCDMIDAGRREMLRRSLGERFPRAEIFECSARDGSGLDDWFQRITTAELSPHSAMNVDYQIYGQGEALLGWLNAAIAVSSAAKFDGNELLLNFAGQLHQQLRAADVEVAHLKMTLTPTGDSFDIGAVNLVASDRKPELSHSLLDPVAGCDLILNLRAEAMPDVLETLTRSVIAGWQGQQLTLSNLESFQPGQPNPTHRISAIS
jgi:Ni2+-binding GTPase involved in maturation of urease and hydrogenase